MKNSLQKEGGLGFGSAALWTGLTLFTFVLCVSLGSVNISIPDVFRAVNTMTLYGDEFRPKSFYGGLIGQGYGRASDCIACGQCEGVCPQHLPIINLLKDASTRLDG